MSDSEPFIKPDLPDEGPRINCGDDCTGYGEHDHGRVNIEQPRRSTATCKTCGGTPPNHVPSMFDPNGIGHTGHRTKQPTHQAEAKPVDGELHKIMLTLHVTVERAAGRILDGDKNAPKEWRAAFEKSETELAAHLQSQVEAAVREAEDVVGLKERRQEIYQIWQWSTSKAFKKNIHESYIYMLYRRFNDLTDQLIEATGNKSYAHYERDKDGSPMDEQLKQEES